MKSFQDLAHLRLKERTNHQRHKAMTLILFISTCLILFGVAELKDAREAVNQPGY